MNNQLAAQDEICNAIKRENDRVTYEWGQLIERLGEHCGHHEDAIALAEMQGQRSRRMNDKYGIKVCTKSRQSH